MNIFLSWSGPRSEAAAKLFHSWIIDILQSARPWMSSEDISSGASWNSEIRNSLSNCNYGIIFVTRDNLESPWLMFEAGALSKQIKEAHVVPLIVDEDLDVSQLRGPLAQLQARKLGKESLFWLVREIQ